MNQGEERGRSVNCADVLLAGRPPNQSTTIPNVSTPANTTGPTLPLQEAKTTPIATTRSGRTFAGAIDQSCSRPMFRSRAPIIQVSSRPRNRISSTTGAARQASSRNKNCSPAGPAAIFVRG